VYDKHLVLGLEGRDHRLRLGLIFCAFKRETPSLMRVDVDSLTGLDVRARCVVPPHLYHADDVITRRHVECKVMAILELDGRAAVDSERYRATAPREFPYSVNDDSSGSRRTRVLLGGVRAR
jgi:hypothetical protein